MKPATIPQHDTLPTCTLHNSAQLRQLRAFEIVFRYSPCRQVVRRSWVAQEFGARAPGTQVFRATIRQAPAPVLFEHVQLHPQCACTDDPSKHSTCSTAHLSNSCCFWLRAKRMVSGCGATRGALSCTVAPPAASDTRTHAAPVRCLALHTCSRFEQGNRALQLRALPHVQAAWAIPRKVVRWSLLCICSNAHCFLRPYRCT